MELGALQKPELLSYILNVIALDPSPYIRRNLLKVFTTGLGSLAIYGGKKVEPEKPQQPAFGEMIVEEENGDAMGETAMKRRQGLAREGIVGAMKALKEELGGDKGFSETLWNAIGYTMSCLAVDDNCANVRYKIDGAGYHGITRTTGYLSDSIRCIYIIDGYPEITKTLDL